MKPMGAKRQPKPKRGNPSVTELVIGDLEARKKQGVKKYGHPLEAHNGRSALLDAYQEALDLSLYLRQALEENEPSK